MPIDSDSLQAFEVVSRLRNFTAAAAELHLSQPALSRRIQNLEIELGAVVFLRNPRGLELTAAGQRLLRYAETKALLENELLSDLTKSKSQVPEGHVKIAGYTSILHTVITHSIGAFIRANPQVTLEYQASQNIKPNEKQASLLLRYEIDLLISIFDLSSRDIVCEKLGEQRLICIESTVHDTPKDVYLDTRPEDPTTTEYLKKQRVNPTKPRRSFLYDEEGIIRGVTEGIGRAVVFPSFIRKGMAVREVRGSALSWPIYLAFRKQSHYLPAVEGVKQAILKSAPKFLD